jgi:ribosome-associated protein
MEVESNVRLEQLVRAIQDKKGFNILVLDVQKISSLTYYFVIAEGRVERHLRAIADEAVDRMAKLGCKPYMTEGEKDGGWLVLDFGEMIVHLFTPHMRDKYRLEEVWREGKIVDYPPAALVEGDADFGLAEF